MADFELKKKDLNVKIYGVDYVLRKPSVAQVEDLVESMGKEELKGKEMKSMRLFMQACGVPEKLCAEMDADDFNSLAEFIMDATKKKLVPSGSSLQK